VKAKNPQKTHLEKCTFEGFDPAVAETTMADESSGGKTRTYDLWVMSPTSYQLLHPAIWWVQKYTAQTYKPNKSGLVPK
jgi:hypothetical protein